MNGTRNRPRITGVLLAVVFGVPGPAAGQHAGVSADPTVEPASLASFEGLDAGEVWRELNGLAYWEVPLEIPDDYYEAVDVSSADTLRATLHELIDDHRIYPYTHSSRPTDANHKVDTWDVIAVADAHPFNPQEDVLDLYLNDTFDRQLGGTRRSPRYDREHSWPKSLGFSKKTTKNPAYSDCHHLFAAYNSYNSSRSNKPYGTGDPAPESRKPTLENVGRGGGDTPEPETFNYSFADRWQTWIGRRGDVARAMFYMDVRYEGSTANGIGEPDLQLTDDIGKVTQRNVWKTGGVAFMGLKSVLLEWHQQDPVDDLERRRNTVVYLFQGNRNPFVDHPEWVGTLFSNGGGSPTILAGEVWINEFHYDNQGTDENEFVEVAGPAGTNLSGWKLVGYNGNGGRGYKTVTLTGTIPDLRSGFGVLVFEFQGLQNGEPDGIALVQPSGEVVEFIAYDGGRFTAADGPAAGMIAHDIGMKEPGNTPQGQSLQVIGSGTRASEFTWTGPEDATPGAVNANQHFNP